MTMAQAIPNNKLKFLIAGLAAALIIILPASASALTVKFKSTRQVGNMTCEEAKYSVYHYWGYTINSAECYYSGETARTLLTPNYRYYVTKAYEKCNWFMQNCGSWQTTIDRVVR